MTAPVSPLQPNLAPARHTPAPWEAQPFDAEENGVALIGLPMNGMVAWVTLHPTEIDAQDATRAQANAAFIVAAVNSHATLTARNRELEAALRQAEMKLRGVVAYATGNAKAAKIDDDEKTWKAHADVVVRVCKGIRAALLPGTPAVSR